MFTRVSSFPNILGHCHSSPLKCRYTWDSVVHFCSGSIGERGSLRGEGERLIDLIATFVYGIARQTTAMERVSLELQRRKLHSYCCNTSDILGEKSDSKKMYCLRWAWLCGAGTVWECVWGGGVSTVWVGLWWAGGLTRGCVRGLMGIAYLFHGR